jgi:hypothetical protein
VQAIASRAQEFFSKERLEEDQDQGYRPRHRLRLIRYHHRYFRSSILEVAFLAWQERSRA